MKIGQTKIGFFVTLVLLIIVSCSPSWAQLRRSPKSYVEGGVAVQGSGSEVDSVRMQQLDSLRAQFADSLSMDSLTMDSLFFATDSMFLAAAAAIAPDSTATPLALKESPNLTHTTTPQEEERQPFFSDSMSLSKVCWMATVLPGYGQIYNKQYWKLPLLYGTVGAGIALYINENNKYQPLKEQYDNLILSSGYTRNEELNTVQSAMIQSNTRRQLYLGATIATYMLFLGDAAINYSTNDVSDIKKATTLSMICPGAGQVYNKSYWRVPIVLGMFASTAFVYDWNNRGYIRFNTAYTLTLDYENNPDNYPNGSIDEFGGAYSSSYMKSLRDSYRRNRDLAIILTGAAYLLQVLDAHVDAHLKDFDISDDLSLHVEPAINYNYDPATSINTSYGLNFNFRF